MYQKNLLSHIKNELTKSPTKSNKNEGGEPVMSNTYVQKLSELCKTKTFKSGAKDNIERMLKQKFKNDDIIVVLKLVDGRMRMLLNNAKRRLQERDILDEEKLAELHRHRSPQPNSTYVAIIEQKKKNRFRFEDTKQNRKNGQMTNNVLTNRKINQTNK